MNVFSIDFQRLATETVVDIFEKFKVEDKFHVDNIEGPRSGDVFIFWSSDETKSRDWLVDGFSWRNQGGRKPSPPAPNPPKLFKSYYHLIDQDKQINKNVLKDVYFHPTQPFPIVIHYLDKSREGNVELEYPTAPHGNIKDKQNSEGFMRTLPSVYSQLKEKVCNQNPHLVYKQSNKKNGARDLKQCQNLRYAVNRQRRFTYDEIANIHLMHISLSFPNQILTAPDIRIICVDDELLKETKKTLSAFDSNNRICFQFDTTFNLTGYYVSVLLFIHPILTLQNSEKSPAIPLAYYVHEKKHEKSHNEFWRYIQDILPELTECGFIVTDCEDAFRNAIRRHFPELPLLRCWNHFWKATERWISSCKQIPNDEIGLYCDSLRELFLQPTRQQFEIQLKNKISGYINNSGNIVKAWRPEFVNYFNSRIVKEIDNLAAYSVKPVAKNLFNHFTGITTNQSEGINNLLKLVQQRTELPLDIVILSLQQLSIYYCNEVKYGFGNRGVYRLRPEYKEKCYVNTKYVNTRESLEPSKIIESLVMNKEELLESCGVKFSSISEESAAESSDQSDIETIPEVSTEFSNKTLTQSTKTIGSTLQDCSSSDDLDEILMPDSYGYAQGEVNCPTDDQNVEDVDFVTSQVDDQNIENVNFVETQLCSRNVEDISQDGDDEDNDKPIELKNRYNSKVSRALWLVNNDKIKLDIKLKIYFVVDEINNCFQVKLLPKPTCSCIDKQICSHILAVQSINGIDISNSYRIPNLAQLTISKNSGSTGRKRKGHRVNSIDVQSTSSSIDSKEESTCFLQEILNSDSHHLLNEITNRKLLIKSSMIISDHRDLSDIFLTKCNLDSLSIYFNKSTWKQVKTLIGTKVVHCTCPVCSDLCLEKSIECDTCFYWYHFDCGKCSTYYRSGKAKSWSCSKYGFECDTMK